MYEQAIYFDEDNPEGYVKYANVYFNTDGGKRFAIQKLVELLQKNPSSALGQRELAENTTKTGNGPKLPNNMANISPTPTTSRKTKNATLCCSSPAITTKSI